MTGAPTASPVLIIDDEQAALEEYAELLELMGLPVTTESCPMAARERVLADAAIRVVVTDLRMARLDGVTLIRTLREALPPDRTVRFIMLTGMIDLAPDQRLEDVPALAKPVDFELLVRMIRERLDP
ncbi:response regulator [Novosphingobium jiangmenense]|uniref:Response regulator n=1 Tax=Novosphingobium jiangmenense TaxID=2791981 RepID=A0ABS0HBW9_9SPHN|nr:response regulator [Novosphingobium jiangmenense]MBF9149681.1 response regulator [Novosphingobium jiangmenense]